MKSKIKIILMMLGVMFFTYGCSLTTSSDNKAEDTEMDISDTQEEESREVTSELEDKETREEIGKIDDTKELVYDVFNAEGSDYIYAIPAINIDAEEVMGINSQIEKECRENVDPEIANSNQGISVFLHCVEYESYVNDNILSLVISQKYENDFVEYVVYNVDISTGKAIDNTELLERKDIPESELATILGDKYIELYGTEEEYINRFSDLTLIEDHKQWYRDQYNRTISGENCNDTLIFLNENNKINIIANIYSMAGADFYAYILEIE